MRVLGRHVTELAPHLGNLGGHAVVRLRFASCRPSDHEGPVRTAKVLLDVHRQDSEVGTRLRRFPACALLDLT